MLYTIYLMPFIDSTYFVLSSKDFSTVKSLMFFLSKCKMNI